MMLPRDTGHAVQRQHKVVRSHINNTTKGTFSLVMGYEHSSPAQVIVQIIPQLSNTAVISAQFCISGYKFCAFIVEYEESVFSLNKLMLNTTLCNKEPESAFVHAL